MQKLLNFSNRYLINLPLIIAISMASFGVASILMLILGLYGVLTVLALGVVLSVIASKTVLKHVPKNLNKGYKKEAALFTLVLFGFVFIWSFVNMYFASSHLVINRDPGIYGNTAYWLVENDNLNFEYENIWGDQASIETSGFHEYEGQVYAQGTHMYPSLLAIGGRIVGGAQMFHLPVLFGSVALLIFYYFSTHYIRPRWAMLGTAIFGSSLPLIYFSRETFTEPMAIVFMFLSILSLRYALATRSVAMWGLAGVLLGGLSLVRIDGLLLVSAAAAILVTARIVEKSKPAEERNMTRMARVAFLIGLMSTLILAWVDLFNLSYPYLQTHISLIQPLILMALAILLFGAVAVFVEERWHIFRTFEQKTRTKKRDIVVLAVLAVSFFMVSRPLWHVGNDVRPLAHVAFLQAKEDKGIQAFRSYSELTTQWISTYIGPITFFLGIAGLAIFAYRATKDRSIAKVVPLFFFLTVAALYLVRPAITPDQIWASRRFITIVTPMMIFFGMYTINYLYERLKGKYDKTYVYLASIMVAGYLLMAPLIVSRPYWTLKSNWQYGFVDDICNTIGENDSVMYAGHARWMLTQATRSVCGIEAVAFGATLRSDTYPIRQDQLIEFSNNVRSQGKRPVIGITGDQKALFENWQGQGYVAVTSYTYFDIEQTLTRVPEARTLSRDSILFTEVTPDGRLIEAFDPLPTDPRFFLGEGDSETQL